MPIPPVPVVPPEVEAVVRGFIGQASPNREIARIRLCASAPSQIVLRVFFSSEMKPAPYGVYRVELPNMAVYCLRGKDAEVFKIPHYK